MIHALLLVSYRSGGLLFSRFYGPGLSREDAQARCVQQLYNVTKHEWANLLADRTEQCAYTAEYQVMYKLIGDVVLIMAGTEEHDQLLLLEFGLAFEHILRQQLRVPAGGASASAASAPAAGGGGGAAGGRSTLRGVFAGAAAAPSSAGGASLERRILRSYSKVCMIVEEMVCDGDIDHLDGTLVDRLLSMKA